MDKKPEEKTIKSREGDLKLFLDLPRPDARAVEPLIITGLSRLPKKIRKQKHQGGLKRAFDIFGAGCGLLVLSPLLITVGFLIWASSPGPMIFTQRRVGKAGRLFNIYKFRTMYKDAEIRKKALMAQNEIDGPAFKMKNDPRITPIGRFLRRYSIDELPQLFNVVKGDMSLVGPRPALVEETKAWDQDYFQRLSVEQGLTCIWQISGRSDVSFDQWMAMDLDYVRNWNFGLDIKLVAKTVLVVFKGQGAY